jgi:hypothetical protein
LGVNKYETGKVSIKYDVSEVHLFDATYGDQTNVVNWANYKIALDAKLAGDDLPNKRGALRTIFLPFDGDCNKSGTTDGSRQIETGIGAKLKDLPQFKDWYRVQPTRIQHNSIPTTFGYQLLADASARLDDTLAGSKIHACCQKEPAKCGVKEPFKQQSLEYEEPDYFAESETNY